MPRVVGRSSEKLHISAITITLAGAAWHNMTPAFDLFRYPSYLGHFVISKAQKLSSRSDMCDEGTKLNFPWNSCRQHSAQISLTPGRFEAGGGGGITPNNFMVNSSPPSCLPPFLGQSIRSGFCPILLCPEKSLRVSWPGSLPRQFLTHLPFYFFYQDYKHLWICPSFLDSKHSHVHRGHSFYPSFYLS